MSDMKLAEFRERAERGLGLPDLEDLERRGRSLRRRRAAAGAGGLALALAAIAGIANVATGGPDTAPQPAPATQPPATPASGMTFVPGESEDVLVPGPAWVTLDADGAAAGASPIKVTFDVGDPNWEWSSPGLGLRKSSATPDEYAATVFFLPLPAARLGSCQDERVGELGTDPGKLLANVAPLLDLARSSVLEPPRVVTAFGHTAVHLRLRTNVPCPADTALPGQLAGQVSGGMVDPGWGGTQVLDVWHVVLEGDAPTSMLIASWEHPGATDAQLVDRQELLDSVQVEVG